MRFVGNRGNMPERLQAGHDYDNHKVAVNDHNHDSASAGHDYIAILLMACYRIVRAV